MNGCNKIIECILKNCANLVPGVKDRAFFINIDDIDKSLCTFDSENSLILTSIALKDASPEVYAYCVEGYNFSNEHTAIMVKRRYQKVWDHNFIFRIFDNTPEDKAWIQNAIDSRFVIIIENNYNKALDGEVAGRTVFEVLGWDFGLELNAVERDVNNEETLGGWVMTAGCSDQLKESMPPRTLFVGGTLATTQAAIVSMLAPCCPSDYYPAPAV